METETKDAEVQVRQAEYEQLVNCLEAGNDVHRIRTHMGIDGSSKQVREWIVQTARTQPFADELTRRAPRILGPLVQAMWGVWSQEIAARGREDVTQLRRLVRAVVQMSVIVGTYLKDNGHA